MFFLGIDIGKNSHVASLTDDKKKVIFKAFSFSNSIDGAECLICKLEPFKNQLEIGMEATGHYWINLFSFLLQKNFSVHLINPIQTDGWRNSTENLDFTTITTATVHTVHIGRTLNILQQRFFHTGNIFINAEWR